jgi:hypothetical protein
MLPVQCELHRGIFWGVSVWFLQWGKFINSGSAMRQSWDKDGMKTDLTHDKMVPSKAGRQCDKTRHHEKRNAAPVGQIGVQSQRHCRPMQLRKVFPVLRLGAAGRNHIPGFPLVTSHASAAPQKSV